MTGKCKDCRWWDSGICHRYPPKIVTVTSDHLHVLIASTEWPATYQDDFCGEFTKRERS